MRRPLPVPAPAVVRQPRKSLVLSLLLGLLVTVPATGQSTWVDLFPNGSFERWERLDGSGKGVDEIRKNWRFDDQGHLELYRPAGGGSSLLTKMPVGDFELSFFWKIDRNCNNGIKYRVQKYGNQTLGLEYQLLDDEMRDGSTQPQHRTAAIYDLVPPADPRPVNPAESWNHSRIKVQGDRIEHWLNGVEVVFAVTASDEWQEAVNRSKFRPHSQFGRNTSGKIMITDHGGRILFKHMLLKQLGPADTL